MHCQNRYFFLYFAITTALSFLLDFPINARPIDAQSTPIFENVTLSPNFNPDPLTIRGLSGGPVSAETTAGRTNTSTGPCSGFVDQQPDHTQQGHCPVRPVYPQYL